MNRSSIHWGALACSAALSFVSAAALAQSCPTGMAAFNVVNTSPPTLVATTAGSAGSICAATGLPVCTIAGPTTAQDGVPIVLTANCTGATSWGWTGCPTPTLQTCNDPGAYTGTNTITYTVTGTGPLGTSVPVSQVVTWSISAPAAPGGCSISGAPTGAQTAGYVATLTMNCTTGGAATSYSWTGGAAAGQTSQTVAVTVNTTTTFTAKAINATGTSPAAQATVTITGGGGSYVCNMPGTSTPFPGGTVVVPMSWVANGLYYSSGFVSNGALVAYFDTPASNPSPPPSSGKGSIVGVQWTGRIEPRTGSLSATPCDFTNGFAGDIFGDQDGPTVYFTFGYAKSGYPQLKPGTRYFLNMYNTSGCSQNPCDVRLTFTKPNGT